MTTDRAALRDLRFRTQVHARGLTGVAGSRVPLMVERKGEPRQGLPRATPTTAGAPQDSPSSPSPAMDPRQSWNNATRV